MLYVKILRGKYIMLDERVRGYAVMNKKLTSIFFEHVDLETCKRYRKSNNVIVERIPVVRGFNLKFFLLDGFDKIISRRNILYLHWFFMKVYIHKCGQVVLSTQSN